MAEIVKNLSEGSIELPQVSAPGTTTDKLYNVAGALTFNGTDISSGGGLVDIVDDTTPQLGGDLDVNGYNITTINGSGNGITLVTSAASPSGSSGGITIATANSNAVVNSLVQGQDETDYTFDFNGGTGHAVSDVITMTDGSTVTVDSLSGSAVLTFTVTTSGGVDVPILPHPQNLLQSSTTGSGTGFLLQPQGNNVVQDAQTGGDLTLTAGDGGTSTTGGGDVIITSGRQRGQVLISTGDARTTGNGAYAGKINLEVGTSFQNSGENVNIFAGDADYEGGDAFGGDVRIVAGNAFGTGGDPDNSYGGVVRIEGGRALYGGSGALPYEGGNVQIDGGQSEFYGGDVVITSGDTTGADGIAGNIILQTPDGGYGASIRVYGGDASFASAAGADIRIKAGNSTSGHGGDVEFTFGTAPGDAGAMVINTSVAPSSTTNKLYNIAGALTWNGSELATGGTGITDVVEDTTPQLGGNLDINAFDIVSVDATYADDINLYAGDSSTGTGGGINLTAGDHTGSNTDGGAVAMIGGSGYYSGGGVTITGGPSTHSSSVFNGGDISIVGGSGGASGASGGDITLQGGATTGGSTGAIVIPNQVAPTVTTNKLYSVAGALTWNGTDLTAGGGGDVSKVGTPVDNQIGVWTGDGTIEGDALITWDGSATTADALVIDAPSGLTSGFLVDMTSNVSGKTGTVTRILQNHSSSTADALLIHQNSTNASAVIFEALHSAASSAAYAARIRTSGIFSGGSVLNLHHDNASSTGPVLTITQDGAGNAVTITGGNAFVTDGNIDIGTEMLFTERADHVFTPAATRGILWLRSDSPNALIFTDDAGTDHDLTTVFAFGEYGGEFDASGSVFPTTSNQGDWFNTTVAGTVDGQAFIVGDILVALVDSPSTGTFAANWTIVPNISITDHVDLANIGTNTHAQIDTHIADVSIHRELNDAGSSTTELWSADKIATEIAAGGGGLTVVSVTSTSATTAAAQATMVDDDTAAGVVTITLLAGSANDQQVIKKLGTTANVIVDGDSAETIDGAATFTLTAQYASLSLIWNGTEWSII